MKKNILTLIIAMAFISGLQAQVTNENLKAADGYFLKSDYASAAAYYEKYMDGNKGKSNKDGYNPYTVLATYKKSATPLSTKEQAVYKLAECYRKLNYFTKAESFYKTTIDNNASQFPLAKYYYGITLRAQEKFAEAEKAEQSFLDTYKQEDEYSVAAKKEILNLRFIQQQLFKKSIALYTVEKSAVEINAEGAAYAPNIVNSNTIFFTSTKTAATKEKYNVHANRIYQANYTGGKADAVALLQVQQEKDIQQGATALSPNGNTLYITRWSISHGKKDASIFISTKKDNEWSSPVPLNAAVNASGYSSQQPFVMPDGKHLLFASNMPGGKGGFDLWIADINDNGNPQNVVNLGSTINTSYDEVAPYYHGIAGELVFSGNGRIGMGGFDFFESKGQPGSWAEPVNMGYPVNSVKDDIYFVSKATDKNLLSDVLLSSDRGSACCLELFSLKKQKVAKKISGLVIDCETNTPLAGAEISFIDAANKTVLKKTTGNDGAYSFTLDEFEPINAVAELKSYEKGGLQFNAPEDNEAVALTNPAICLVKTKRLPCDDVPQVGEAVVLENVYFEFDKQTLKPESYEALDKLVQMLNADSAMVIELSGHTDNKGKEKYNTQLSQKRAEACVAYIAGKGIDKSRLIAVGYGAKLPVALNSNTDGSDNPEGRDKNRRTEFKILKK